MKNFSFISLLAMCLALGFGITPAAASTVEFPSSLHFLDPGGDDVVVGPGRYSMEAAESWLKIVPEGEEAAAAVLLESISGTHEEKVTEPTVRLEAGRIESGCLSPGIVARGRDWL